MNPRTISDVFENELYLFSGFTYLPHNGFLKEWTRDKFPPYIVAKTVLYTDKAAPTDAQIRDMIQRADDAGVYLGGWVNSDGSREYTLSHGFYNLESAIDYSETPHQEYIFETVTMKALNIAEAKEMLGDQSGEECK